jgi:hypothetical protein
MEFGERTIEALNWSVANNKTLVIAAHPAALGFKQKYLDEFNRFIDLSTQLQQEGKIVFRTVSDYLNLSANA